MGQKSITDLEITMLFFSFHWSFMNTGETNLLKVFPDMFDFS